MSPHKEQLDITIKLDKLEQKLQQLKSEYELFFLGFQRSEPSDRKEDVRQFILSLEKIKLTNPVHKFKFQVLKSRFTSYNLRWLRTIREIEEGRYKPHLLRAKTRGEARLPSGPTIDPVESNALSLYGDYLEKSRELNYSPDNINVEKIRKLIRHQTSKIKREYGCDDVEFSIIESGGVPKIKATPIFKGTGSGEEAPDRDDK